MNKPPMFMLSWDAYAHSYAYARAYARANAYARQIPTKASVFAVACLFTRFAND